MTIDELKHGDIVVIEKIFDKLKECKKSRRFGSYVGVICEVEEDKEFNMRMVKRRDDPAGRCVLNGVYAIYATFRMATDREKFLYMACGVMRA